jgi:hypothetical protein
MDELTRIILTQLKPSRVRLLGRDVIESYDPELTSTMHNRTTREYLWTMTPTFVLRTLESFPEIDVLTYLDADQYFFNFPETIKKDLGTNTCLIHEHRFSKGLEFMAVNGIFNVGVMSFKNTQNGRNILRWWREKCIDWCYSEPLDGKFGDQGYLNDWPQRFEGIHVTNHIGIGVAPWNMASYNFSFDTQATPHVDLEKIIIFHFHGLKLLHPCLILLMENTLYKIPSSALEVCYLPYCKSLLRSYLKICEVFPDFFNGFASDTPLSVYSAVLARGDLRSVIENTTYGDRLLSYEEDWLVYKGEQVI